jgi:fatty acid desaturase
MYTKEHSTDANRARSPARTVLIIFIVATGALLILEHRAHVLGYWPLLLLAACIGSHFFMHRGHDKGAGHGH